MTTLNYNGTKIKYTSFTSEFESLLDLNMVKLFNGDKEVASLMLTNKELELL
jgi:hypothetical protein